MLSVKQFLFTESIDVPGVINYMIILRAAIGGENQPIAIEVFNEIRGIEGVVTVKQRAPLKDAPGNKKMILISLTMLESIKMSDEELTQAIKNVSAIDMVVIKEKDGLNQLKSIPQQIAQPQPQIQTQTPPIANESKLWKQARVSPNTFVRVFNPKELNESLDELEWHRDQKTRHVTVVEAGGWKFQFDNKMPTLLESGQKITIPAGHFHRVIKGDTSLVLLIKEKN
jgi:mannose-6-phosphate isomerase-like protein (cupin superfamily)